MHHVHQIVLDEAGRRFGIMHLVTQDVPQGQCLMVTHQTITKGPGHPQQRKPIGHQYFLRIALF